MAAGGVVGHRPANGRAVAAGRVGTELEAVGAQGCIQLVEDDAGLDARPALLGIDLDYAIQMTAEIDHQGFVDRLPGQAGAGGTWRDRQAVFSGQRDGGDDILDGAWNEHRMGHELVEAGVGAVEHARVVVGSQIAGDVAVAGRDERRHPLRSRPTKGGIGCLRSHARYSMTLRPSVKLFKACLS